MVEHRPTREVYGAAYSGQVDYLNRLTLATIDRILDAPGRDKVVMVFSDHGSPYGLDWTDLDTSDLDERTANLVAIRTPDGRPPIPMTLPS